MLKYISSVSFSRCSVHSVMPPLSPFDILCVPNIPLVTKLKLLWRRCGTLGTCMPSRSSLWGWLTWGLPTVFAFSAIPGSKWLGQSNPSRFRCLFLHIGYNGSIEIIIIMWCAVQPGHKVFYHMAIWSCPGCKIYHGSLLSNPARGAAQVSLPQPLAVEAANALEFIGEKKSDLEF